MIHLRSDPSLQEGNQLRPPHLQPELVLGQDGDELRHGELDRLFRLLHQRPQAAGLEGGL